MRTNAISTEVEKIIVLLENLVMAYGVSLFKCFECHLTFRSTDVLRTHLSQEHTLNFEYEEFSLGSFEELKKWMKQEETTNNIRFKNLRGSKEPLDKSRNQRLYFTCVGSGRDPSSLCYSRTKKGCKKSISRCTCQIIVNYFKSGECIVKYHKTHYGHIDLLFRKCKNNNVPNLLTTADSSNRLEKEAENHDRGTEVDRNEYQRDLAEILGEENENMENIRNGYPETSPGILEIGTDIRNGCRHVDDAISIDLWVKEVYMHEDNPILYYKRKGESASEYFTKSDFCLILINEIQADVLQQLGPNFVCIDNIRSTNIDDIDLTVILVIDESGELFPTACMFSNRRDIHINELFFTRIKYKVGRINVSMFSSDIDDMYYKAWCSSMSLVGKRLFSPWYVEQAWQNHLSPSLDSDRKQHILSSLKDALYRQDEESFIGNYNAIIAELLQDGCTHDFVIYLIEHFNNCVDQWASCYHMVSQIPLNEKLRDMHQKLDYIYFKGNEIERVDKTLVLYQKLIKDKVIGRLIKIPRKKISKQITAQHKQGFHLECEMEQKSEILYILKTKNSIHYVEKVNNNLPCCIISCLDCDICIHTFECTCLENNIKIIICRHIHSVCVHQKLFSNKPRPGSTRPKILKERLVNYPLDATNTQTSDGKQISDAKSQTKAQGTYISIPSVFKQNDGLPNIEISCEDLQLSIKEGLAEDKSNTEYSKKEEISTCELQV